jgi:Holliday junction resolvasome RuvABC ATP-dependent DNA helicase subunit
VPLDWCGLTHDGLNVTAQAYLVTLAGAFEGVAGERSIAAALGERGGLLHTEKLCMSKGLLMITPQGRALTDTGWARAAELTSELHLGAAHAISA